MHAEYLSSKFNIATFNSFVNVGIQGLKISEAITSFSKLKKNRSLLEGIAN